MQEFSQVYIEGMISLLVKATLSKATKSSKFTKSRITRIEKSNAENQACFYLEQFTQTQATQKILNEKETAEFLFQNIPDNFKNACLECRTLDKNFTVNVLSNKKGKVTVLEKECKAKTPCLTSMPKESLNRTKNYILQENVPVPFLVHLGVMTKEGKVVNAKYDKFRQINRFLEYIRDILPELTDSEGCRFNKNTPQKNASPEAIRIVDFGCGKSYLTFAVYHYLNAICGLPVEMVGVDLKQDVISLCSKLAVQFGYENLKFYCGSIEDYFAKNTGKKVDLVITLHACDTATDYALACAIKQGAKAILSVPCCQHELNLKVGKKLSDGGNPASRAMETILKYGIARERFLSLATDVMRCELLESCGYSTQLLEFIDMSHTPKNLLIRAVKKTDKKPENGYNEMVQALGQEITLAKLLDDNSEE